MAIGWLSVLKMVPWGDVISNAPKVAEGAKKLWTAVAKKSPVAELSSQSANTELSPDVPSIAILQAQLAAAGVTVSELHNQMVESTALIKALADQNTQLIKRIEVNRIRGLWLAGIMVALGVVTAINLSITLAR